MFSKTVIVIMLTLLAMIAVCNALYISADVSFNASFYGDDGKDEGKEKKIGKITDGIDKASSALKKTKEVINAGKPPDFKAVISVVAEFSTLGSLLFPQLKVLSSSLALLNVLLDGGESPDDKITKGIY